jgi:hypothetical protein
MIGTTKAYLAGAPLALGIVLGLGIGWKLWSPKPTPPAIYRPPIQQADGSQVIEVKPDAHAKPPHQIPHGATVEDVVHVVVQPSQPDPPASLPPSGSVALEPSRPCPPVTLDLSIVQLPDGTRRVVASSPDGKILSAVQIPAEAARPPAKVLKWAAGCLWNPQDHTYGGFVDRDFAFIRLGAEVIQQRAPVIAGGGLTWGTQIKVGIRF